MPLSMYWLHFECWFYWNWWWFRNVLPDSFITCGPLVMGQIEETVWNTPSCEPDPVLTPEQWLLVLDLSAFLVGLFSFLWLLHEAFYLAFILVPYPFDCDRLWLECDRLWLLYRFESAIFLARLRGNVTLTAKERHQCARIWLFYKVELVIVLARLHGNFAAENRLRSELDRLWKLYRFEFTLFLARLRGNIAAAAA